MKILISGAGPTGLTAALELYRRGFKPRIIDRKAQPSPLSRAVGINARSLDLLEKCGVTDELLKRGIRMKQAIIHENGHIIGTLHVDALPYRFNFLLALPQDQTEGVMLDRLAAYGGAVDYATELKSLTLEGGKARVAMISKGAESQDIYDLVIGADGIHSPVRAALGIPFEGHDLATRWSIADFTSHDWPYPLAQANLFTQENGHIGIVVPIGHNRFRAVANEPKALPLIPVRFTPDEIHGESDFVISFRQAKTYQKDCVYLAGDAAHVHSPAGARGMNLGIEDACDLARRVAENDLEGYTAARHPVGRAVLLQTELLTKFATLRNPVLKALRRVLLVIVSAFPIIQRPVIKSVSGLS